MGETAFTEFFGSTPLMRVLGYLLDNRHFDYSKKDVAEGAGISRAALYAVWPNIETRGIVRVTRRFGRTRLYALNQKNELVKKLLELDRALFRRRIGEFERETRGVSVKALEV